MPNCKNCGKEFPNKIIVKGSVRSLAGRKFCPSCSPLDGRNTRSYIVELNNNEAFCARCQKIKNRDEFYIRKDSGHPFSYCMKCQKEIKELKLQEKLERIVEERGCTCADCKVSFPTQIYEFYSDNGNFCLSRAKNMSFQKIKNELKDYTMLCLNCSAMRVWARG